ncbi:hypothetical protein [Comamonas sp. JC664]|uniref:hypothetical protein n=1 Tax=Comamonas sp. JC664 TaxID=2801917 RepID=UPI003616BB5E
MSGLYSDFDGARWSGRDPLAVADFGGEVLGRKIEISRPTTRTSRHRRSKARQWWDTTMST